MKQKLKLGKPLKIVITTVAIFVFTILAHYFSVESVGNNFIDVMGSFRLIKELPSVLAQTPTPTFVPSINPTLNVSPTPVVTPLPKLSPSATPSPEVNTETQKTKISENTVFWLLFIVVNGVLALLFTLLSPTIGFPFFGGKWSPGNLADKARFLTESFPKLLEGVTVVLIVMVVTVLTLAGYVKEQGTISILSALIGYVLGRKASELEFKTPPDQKNKNPTSLSISPKVAEVKFGSQLNIKIDPAQEIESYEVQPPTIGKVKMQDQSTLVYQAPSKSEAGSTTEVTITVTSRTHGIPPASAKIQLIEG
ncbi:MAG: hypothetical protein ACKO2V_25885 [Snowella sp.]